MTSREFRERLTRRARRAKTIIPPAAMEPLEAYFRLLDRWNSKINLTALPLNPATDETFDRLLVEPLAAARLIADADNGWLDLGSGGGSPALPLKIIRPALDLTMVESKARKAAFLREAVRVLNLQRASVENTRFETLAEDAARKQAAMLVTVRAVRTDHALFSVAAKLLAVGGRLVLFRPSAVLPPISGFAAMETVQLTDAPRTFAAVYRRVFHVEQTH